MTALSGAGSAPTGDKAGAGAAWPAPLDLAGWLRLGLAHPAAGVRRFVLEVVGTGGLDDEWHQIVGGLAAEDPDPDCRARAAELLAEARQHRESLALVQGADLSPDALRSLLDSVSAPCRHMLLRSLRGRPSLAALTAWRQRLLAPCTPAQVQMGLHLLSRFGSGSDVQLALRFIDHDATEVAAAALDVLAAHQPTLLIERLAAALAHDQLTVRLHAIRLLRVIDPAAAAVHLQPLLADVDPLVRWRSLAELVLVPVDLAADEYLAFVSAERVPILLVTAGLALVANPSPELPPRLFETVLLAKGAKRHILHGVMTQMVAAIRAAGILGDSTDAYFARLNQELALRRERVAASLARASSIAGSEQPDRAADPVTDKCTQAAGADRSPTDTTAEVPRCCHGLPQERRAGSRHDGARAPARQRETPVSRNATGPTGTDAAAAAASRRLSADQATPAGPSSTRAPLGGMPAGSGNGGSVATVPPAPDQVEVSSSLPGPKPVVPGSVGPPGGAAMAVAAVGVAGFADLPTSEQRRWLKAIVAAPQFSAIREAVLPRLAELPPGTQADLCDLLARFGTAADASRVIPLLEAGDPWLRARAVRAVGHLDAERLVPWFGRFLQDREPVVQAAALQVFLDVDKESALEHLGRMLASPHRQARGLALGLMVRLDQAASEPRLIEFFAVERQPDLRVQAGMLLAANPSRSALAALYAGCHDADDQPEPGLVELWQSAVQAAVPIIGGNEAEVVAIARAGAARLRQAAAKPYARQRVDELRDRRGSTEVGPPGGWREHWLRLVAAAVGLAVGLGWWQAGGGAANGPAKQPWRVAPGGSTAQMTAVRRVEGGWVSRRQSRVSREFPPAGMARDASRGGGADDGPDRAPAKRRPSKGGAGR